MTRYGNGMKEDATRCIQEVHFGKWSRQCLRARVDGPWCAQHATLKVGKWQRAKKAQPCND